MYRSLLQAETLKAQHGREETELRLRDAPTLWNGVLTASDGRLRGPAMLPRARRGAHVDVLEEGVGADQSYLTVRDRDTGLLGWYPRRWVELQHEAPSSDAARAASAS